jgi:prevent-host-death family protein
MQTVNIREAKIHLSRLIEKAAKGEAFIIARAGKPMVKVVPLDEVTVPKKRRIGFMDGQFTVPEDFDTMMADEIEAMFYGNPIDK